MKTPESAVGFGVSSTQRRANRRGSCSARVVALSLALVVFAAFGLRAFAPVPAPVPVPPTSKQATVDWEIFSAPSRLESGEHWVIVGSSQGLPEDFLFESSPQNATVRELARLSPNAIAVRIDVDAGAVGSLLRGQSFERDAAFELLLERGQPSGEIGHVTNRTPDSIDAEGKLVVRTNRFAHAVIPATTNGVAAGRLHNRRTGEWSRLEVALDREREAAQAAEDLEKALADGAILVDPLVELVDTDGNGIPDLDEEPEVREPRPEQIFVKLEPGENLIDILTYDEDGIGTWETLNVFSTFDPDAPGNEEN
jgi:hypothetical protein